MNKNTIIVLLAVMILGLGVYGVVQNNRLEGQIMRLQQASQITQTYPVTTQTQQSSSTNDIARGNGTVTGKLCYPSEGLPSGKIVAKNLATNQEITQNYSGGVDTYTFDLPVGTYHLKYTTPTYLNGYYDSYSSCLNSGGTPECSGQQNRPLLPVTVESGKTASDINLCDFYYNPSNPPTF